MGTFIHYCIHCNAKLNVDSAWLGKSMKCPACGKKITFPDTENSAGNDRPAAPDFNESANIPPEQDMQMPEPPPIASQSGSDTAAPRITLNHKAPKADDMPLPPDAPEPPKTKLKIADNAAASTPENPPADDSKVEEPVPLRAAAPVKNAVCFSDNDTGKTEEARSSKKYFWGRLGSASVWLLAAITLLSCAYFSWHLYIEYYAAEKMIPEKRALATVNKELNEREKNLSNQFKNAVSLLQGSGKISEKGVLDGIAFGNDICLRPDPMPLGLLSQHELNKALQVLEQYKESNRRIKEEFVRSFGKIMLLKKNSNPATAALGGSSQIILQAGELKQRFYSNENYKKSILESLESRIQRMKQHLPTVNAEQQILIKRFEAAAVFVRKQLFPNDNNVTVVRTSRPAAGKSSRGDLDVAAELIVQLADGWQLDREIADMEALLKKVPVLTQSYEEKKNVLWRVMAKEQVKLWLEAILKAFALLVLGDVLRAFFDKADILRRMEEKSL